MSLELFFLIVALLVAGYFGYSYFQLKNQPKSNTLTNSIDLEKEIKQATEKLKTEYENQIQALKNKSEAQLSTENELILSKLKLQLKEEIEAEEKEMRSRILELQENVYEKENSLNTKLEKLEKEKEYLSQLKDEMKNIKEDLLKKRQEVENREKDLDNLVSSKLEEVGKLSLKEAKKKVVETAKEEMGQELISWQHKILENAEYDANIKAREIVAMAIQRCSSEVANEFTITTVKLKSDEEKGKLIGKQGRNLQWIEKTLGVELIIDDTPGIVTISGFSSMRRNIAKRTLEKLLADGRINPSFIEEMSIKAKSEIAEEVASAGEWAVNELGIYDFPAKLIRIIGRLKYRTSYGQNMLKHSVEMAKLAGILCDELNARFPSLPNPIDKMICVKGALLHDIGKAVDEEMQPKGDHIKLGEKICDMFNLDWKIKRCISSHHNEEYNDPEKGFCVEAVIVDACDGISGSRPGARKEAAEAYFERMEAIEKITAAIPGVDTSWVMRGGKEVWAFFNPDIVSPAKMNELTRKIAKEIGEGVKSPVKIKVIGFYDKRVVEFAA